MFLDPGSARAADRELTRTCEKDGLRVIEVQPDVLTRALDTVTPQPIAAIVQSVDRPLDAQASPSLVLVLAGISDPGNAGTLIRGAAGAGADLVVLSKPSVDLYNPKTVRATAGAIFHVPVITDVEFGQALDFLRQKDVKVWGTAARGGTDYWHADLSGPCALVLGNEAHGIPDRVAGALDGLLTIPMSDGTESLNAAIAGSILCFEAARQHRQSPLPAGSGHSGQAPPSSQGTRANRSVKGAA